MQDKNTLYENAVELLKKLIATPSFSKEEAGTFAILCDFFTQNNIEFKTKGFNIWAFNQYFDAQKPTLLLNSHHDTVKPNKSYTRDPFSPDIVDEKLFGLGSNDAGGCLVSLIATFLQFYNQENLKYNIAIAATAEEENSGKGGLESIIPELGKLDFAIVGEPTLMDLAIAEKGLLVLDCHAKGKSGHAARNEGENAIYKALKDIEWFQNYQFTKVHDFFGANGGPFEDKTKVLTTGFHILEGLHYNFLKSRNNKLFLYSGLILDWNIFNKKIPDSLVSRYQIECENIIYFNKIYLYLNAYSLLLSLLIM